MGILQELGRHALQQAVSRPPAVFLPGASPVRLATRKMWVSTAIVGSPKAVFSTTLAVLRPTPGRASSASRVARHLAAVLLDEEAAGRDHVLRLGVEQADRGDVALQPSSPSARICAGVFATGYSLRVALLTPTSVACADRITATSSSNGVV
jgi:hypothetical protein